MWRQKHICTCRENQVHSFCTSAKVVILSIDQKYNQLVMNHLTSFNVSFSVKLTQFNELLNERSFNSTFQMREKCTRKIFRNLKCSENVFVRINRYFLFRVVEICLCKHMNEWMCVHFICDLHREWQKHSLHGSKSIQIILKMLKSSFVSFHFECELSSYVHKYTYARAIASFAMNHLCNQFNFSYIFFFSSSLFESVHVF